MYQVSEAFKTAMHRPVQHTRLRGTITAGSQTILFTEDNIVDGRFRVSGQCSGNENIEIGTVYTSELDMEFCGLNITRYTMQGAVITASLELLTDDGFEGVPLGVFNIKEASRTEYGIEITAYDNMVLLDKGISVDETIGTPYDLAVMAGSACGIQLANTEEELAGLANGTRMISLYPDNDIETWRDFVAWLAQACGCFATIDRSGRLLFRPYNTDPVDELDNYHRLSGEKFADYSTRYTGLSVVNIKEQATKYFGLDQDDALTYNLGSNPFLQYGLEDTVEEMCREILNAISVIDYIPMEVSMIGTPAYDLGDVLVFSDGIADGTKLHCITQYDWEYSGKYSATGTGKNPELSSAKSKTDKNISGLLGRMSSKDVLVESYTNAGKLSAVSAKETSIIAMNVSVNTDAQMVFLALIPFVMSKDGNIIFRYYIDAVPQDDDTVTVYCQRGANVVTLVKSIEMNADSRLTLSVTAQTEYFESDIRKQNAKVDGILDWIRAASPSSMGEYTEHAVDVIPPGAEIAKKSIKAIIFGQGMAVGKWDGTLSFAEGFPVISAITDIITMRGMADALTVGTQVPAGVIFGEAVSRIPVQPGITVKGFSEQAGAGSGAPPVAFVITNHTITTAQADTMQVPVFVGTDGRFQLKTQYTYTSEEQEIDEGRMSVLELPLAQFESVESVVVS